MGITDRPAESEGPQQPQKREEPEGGSADLGVLYAVAEALNSATDVRQTLERTLGLVAGLLGLRTGWVWLLDPETDQFYSVAAQHEPPYPEPYRVPAATAEAIEQARAGAVASSPWALRSSAR